MEEGNRVLVLGASGLIGGLLVPSLARNGHYVIAVSRNSHNTFDSDDLHGKVKTVMGDIFDDNLLKKYIPRVDIGSHNVRVRVIGMARAGPRQDWAKKICSVIQKIKGNKPRYIHIAGGGILSTGKKTLVKDGLLFKLFAKPETKIATVEHVETWKYLTTEAMDIEWLLLCPPYVNEKKSSGGYKAAANVPAGSLISGVKNEDLVAYMVDEVEKARPSDFNHQRVGVSSK